MRLHWNESQSALRRRFAELGAELAAARERGPRAGDFDRAAWRALAEAGLWALPVPCELGGAGESWWEFAAGLEGLSTTLGDLGLLLSIIAHVGCLRVIMDHGTEEQKRTLLPKLMNGAIGATAITEETGGSDVARVQTAAAPRDEGGFELNGSKAHITNAPIADVFVVVGRIPALGARDITLFLLERDAKGLVFSPAEHMLGNETSPTGDFLMDRVAVSPRQVLGEAGNGLSVLYDMISLDRALYGLIAAALAEPVLRRSLHFANQRRAFKKKICEHQYVQQRLTDIKIAIETSRSVAYLALDRLLERDAEAVLMCSLAKLVGTEQLFLVAQHYVQLHGHQGYMVGEISKLLCDAAGTRIAGGTSDIQRVNIFNQLQKLLGHEG